MAASSFKLKQSSLLSFLLPSPTPPPSTKHLSTPTLPSTTTPNTHDDEHHRQPETPLLPPLSTASKTNTIPPSAPTANAYERLRQENLRRNEAFLLRLGVTTLAPPPPPKKKQKTTRLPHPPQPTAPLRRSARHQPHTPDNDHPPSPTITYVDSSILQYTCATSTTPFPTHLNIPISSSRLSITGKPLCDPSLAKIYSMDVRRAPGTNALVAAGGHGGVVSVFGAECGGVDDETQKPLMSWKAGGSWVSGVAFLPDGGKVVLVTSSNDGRVVAWDLTKRESGSCSSERPEALAVSEGLHRGGVFGMDVKWEWVLTASKDASLAMVRVAEDGRFLTLERRIEGHHCGVIRGVCFG